MPRRRKKLRKSKAVSNRKLTTFPPSPTLSARTTSSNKYPRYHLSSNINPNAKGTGRIQRLARGRLFH